MKNNNTFLTTPIAILLGSFVISVAILMHGGIIKIGSKAVTQATVQPSASVQPVPEQPTITLNQIKDAFTKSQIKFGDINKKLIVIEVADPSCPYCHVTGGHNGELNKAIDQQRGGNQFTLVSDGGSYVAPVPEIKKLVDQGKAAFTWIYYPGHGNGEMGTKALYCANEEGKFWPVHDKLMTNEGYNLLNNQVKNDKTKSGDLANFLTSVIDSSQMKSCLDSGKYDAKLNDDMSIATNFFGPRGGTPLFLMNTTKFPGAYSYKDMESTVNAALGT